MVNRMLKALACAVCIMSSTLLHADDWHYRVKPGDNPWSLTQKYLKGQHFWQQLVSYNNITRPRAIPPGTVLRIPVEWLKYQPSQARLVQSTGDVRIIRAPRDDNDLRPTDPDQGALYSGDQVITGKNASAAIEFSDGSRLLLQAETEIVLELLRSRGDDAIPETEVNLPKGRVDTQVNPKRHPDSRYEIRTPAAVATVRGTDFRVQAEGARLMRSEVLSGRVGVDNGVQPQQVPAGFGIVAQADAPPPPPRKLLPAPLTETMPERIITAKAQLHWPAVDGARAYRVQLFPHNNFTQLLRDSVTRAPRFEITGLADGRYSLRVRAIDEVQLEGLNADHPLTIDLRPLAPELLGPSEEALQREAHPIFTWQSVPGATHYRFELGTSAELAKPLIQIDQQPRPSARAHTALSPGVYYWRVAATNQAGKTGPYSQTRRVRIGPVLLPPEQVRVELQEKTARLTWQPRQHIDQYRIQISQEENFSDEPREITTQSPQLSVTLDETGSYYLRVRSEDAQGASQFSETVHVTVSSDPPWWLLLLLIPLALG